MTADASQVLEYAPPAPPGRLRRFFASPLLLLVLILAVAFGLRWFRLGAQSLWLDEFLAVENSTGRGQAHIHFPENALIAPPPQLTQLDSGPGFWAIWTSLRTETHPPLHFMALHAWRQVFGESDLAARGLSVFMSLLAIALLYDVARLLHGPTVALWACLLMALAGAQIQYAQEARNYTMLLALTLAAASAVVRVEKLGVNNRRLLALGASLLATCLTHYLAAGACAALAVYALVRLRARLRDLRLVALSFAAAGVVFLAAWGPFLYQQSRGFAGEISFVETSEADDHALMTLRRLALLPLRYFTEPMKKSINVGYVSAVMFVIPPILLAWRRRDLLLWCLLLAWVLVPVIVSDLWRPAHALSYLRYTFLGSAAVYALAAAMLAHAGGILRHAVPMVIALSCLLAIEEPYSHAKADSRELARYVDQKIDARDVLIVHQLGGDDRWVSGAMYLGLAHYTTPQSPVVFLSSAPGGDVAARLAEAEDVWLMSPTLSIPHEQILPGSKVEEKTFFPWVGTMARIKPRAD